jgi:hypothetical protein
MRPDRPDKRLDLHQRLLGVEGRWIGVALPAASPRAAEPNRITRCGAKCATTEFSHSTGTGVVVM